MNTKLCVSNFAPTTTEEELRSLFSAHGNVAEVNLPLQRTSGLPQGFAIVTMATPQGAHAAILALHGKEMEGRVLTVTEHVLANRAPPAAEQKRKITWGWVVRQNGCQMNDKG